MQADRPTWPRRNRKRIVLLACFALVMAGTLLIAGWPEALSHAVLPETTTHNRSNPDTDSSRHPGDPLEVAPQDTVRKFVWRKIPNNAFFVGERLVFDISYGFVTAGEAILAIPKVDSLEGRTAYHVEVAVNSLPSFSWIYKVEDRYLTFIDTESLASLRFEQHIREGGYRRDFVADFDQVHNIARTTEGEYQVPPYVHDIMSAFFFVRAMDWHGRQPGDTVTLFNFYKNKSYELVVKMLGRQELEVEAGTFKTLVLEPLVREGGLFKSEGRIVVWLTDDEAKMPIRVNTKIVIGSIDTELRSYSGVRAPLTSKVR